MTTLRHNDIWRRDFDISTSLYNDISTRKWRPANIAVAFLLAAMLQGCGGSSDSFEDEPQNVTDNESPQEIRLKADVWRMMEGTRATTYDDLTDLQAGTFTCYAFVDGETTQYISGSTVSYSASEWTFDDGKHYWPTTGALNFLAYMPHDLANTCCTIDPTAYADPGNLDGYSEDCARVVCTSLPVAITKGSDATQELLIAYTAQQDKAGSVPAKQPTAGEVALNFKHPFAKVKFVLSAASGTNVKVNSITIPDIKNNGSFTFDGSTTTWTPNGDDADLVISGNPATDDDAVYLVIPKNYGSKTLTVNATWDDWSDVTKNVSASVDFDWRAGYSYTYTLTLSKYALTVSTSKYTEQW